MESISADLLARLAERSDKAAMRQLARLIIEGVVDSPRKMRFAPKHLLGFAAGGGDRKAGWLLCKYFLEGAPGIDRDFEAACRWRARTEKRLFSDAQLLYSDPALEHEAKTLYTAWRGWLARHWPAECSSVPNTPNARIPLVEENSCG